MKPSLFPTLRLRCAADGKLKSSGAGAEVGRGVLCPVIAAAASVELLASLWPLVFPTSEENPPEGM